MAKAVRVRVSPSAPIFVVANREYLRVNWRYLLMMGLGVSLLALSACGWRASTPAIEVRGPAMGASYSIKFVQPPASLTEDRLRLEVEAILGEITQQFSTYDPDSELSRLNQDPSTGWQNISDNLYKVIEAGLRISRLSDGAFDTTVAPIVDLWGFGPNFRPDNIPAESEIRRELRRVGFKHLRLRTSPAAVYRGRPDIDIDLNALVPGYAADVIATRLEQIGVSRYLVDIGGEMRLKGLNAQGQAWQVAIEQPQAGQQGMLRQLSLTDTAISTSGNYRNFFEIKGKRYSHEIDPRTGYPVSHGAASVTVIAETAMEADAWSTALLVLGPAQGIKIAERERIAVLFVMETTAGGFQEIASTMMAQYLTHSTGAMK